MTTYDQETATIEAVSIPKWSKATVLKVWAAAALPMGLLAWVVTPLLARSFSGPTALSRALILSLTAGLIWQFFLVLLVVRREQGTAALARPQGGAVAEHPHQHPHRQTQQETVVDGPALTGLLALEEMLPAIPSPVSRDSAAFFGSHVGQTWMSGNWGWFVILVVQFVFNTALGEELFFRGLLLPRMGSFGRFDWVINGVLFGCYHLHEPWVIPQTVLFDTFAEALPSRRWRSSLIGIAVHSTQTVFFFVIALTLVLR